MTDTRTRLLEAAERLYAERGIDAVSLREINQAAGARNAVAVQYHFKDRAGVLRAIMARHLPDVDARRHALLDAYEAAGEPDVRALAAALVRPPAAKLADPDGGRHFLQIWAELVSRPQGPPGRVPADPGEIGGSLHRWRALVEPLLAEDAARLHRRYTAILHAAIELARRARSGPHSDDRLFTSYLIDVVTAILAAPVSAETRRLAAERDAARTRKRD
ncbi:regulatory protein, tetR family [Thermomonospora echinospora]|uniref:Regulatory protein, tetR family n=1 Tax=Thermomonospora echinospora TaxID=1992 RepID=A0A1H6E4M7_9ACTN|nr:TetR family transcriptional regulator [Thermomonospora echinospora]SEG92577.1 regulatory protein, tetR family [Thermomonospora echinospora]